MELLILVTLGSQLHSSSIDSERAMKGSLRMSVIDSVLYINSRSVSESNNPASANLTLMVSAPKRVKKETKLGKE